MYARLGLAVLALTLETACFSPRPPGVDNDGPRIRLTLLNGDRRPVFDTNEGPSDTGDRCGEVREFPATPAQVSISINDPGGIDRTVIRAFPGEIVDSSIVAAPDWEVANSRDGLADVAVVTFRRSGDERVLSSALVVLDVRADEPPVSLVVAADDLAGNRSTLYQVDIYPRGSPTICRGEG